MDGSFALGGAVVTQNRVSDIGMGTGMIMLHEGRVEFDVQGEEKESLTVEHVVRRFGASLKDEALLC